MSKKQRTLLLVAVLSLSVLVLSGCALPTGEINLDSPPGWWEGVIVYPLAKLLIVLHNFISGLGMNNSWGWAIVIFTILVKVVTLPLTLKQLQSTKAQQQLQPKLRELQEKYGKDRQKLSEEQMKLYKESGINPMGGCLPILVQMPILFGLYQALYVLANPSVGQLQEARFFWIPDLSFPSLTVGTSWLSAAFQSNDWGKLATYVSLPVLMLVTQLILQKMSAPPKAAAGQQDPQARMMTQMMLFMPLMFAWITLGLPSGLTLYWTVSNILALVQQYFVTGWGGLGDWFPFLKTKQLALAGAGSTAKAVVNSGTAKVGASSEPAAPTRIVSETPDKPIKRRKRRR